jgi:ABC-type Fe3+/spermidine/putrescine transport system ATPase subunit
VIVRGAASLTMPTASATQAHPATPTPSATPIHPTTIEAHRPTPSDILHLDRVAKTYGGHTVLRGVDLAMRAGEFLTLLGPSGCGKTTTLNLVAGLISPSSGTIYLRGKSANTLPPRRRGIGLVFQSWALFPHMTVFDNIAYGLRVRRVPSAEVTRRVGEMLDLVHLPGAADKYPSQLSGGMQQRVALARALVPRPDLLLLDEPLSNLDAALRKEMQLELRRIHNELGVSTLLVTHSQEEALVMSDRIAVMRDGRIACLDTPQRVYENPPTPFVCSFLGDANILDGVVEQTADGEALVDCLGLRLTAPNVAGLRPGARISIAVRPESVAVGSLATRGSKGGSEATVLDMVFKGACVSYRLQAGGQEILALTLPSPDGRTFPPGSRIDISVPVARVIVLEPENV